MPLEINFYPEKATLVLAIDNKIPNLERKRTEAEALGLLDKKEFHFTIIGNITGEDILKQLKTLSEVEKNQKLDEIKALGESIDWKIALKDEYFYLKKEYNDPDLANPEVTIPEIRESIIQMAEIDGIDEFYKKLNAILGQSFKTSLPHITLYANSTREDKKTRGIGTYSKEQLEELKPKQI